MPTVLQDFGRTLSFYLPSLVAAIVVLIIGVIIAFLLAALVRGALNRTRVDDRIAARVTGRESGNVNVAGLAGQITFYIVLLFTLIAFFQTLGLTVITGPLNGLLAVVFDFLPRLLGAALLALVAWVVATLVRTVLRQVLQRFDVDRRLNDSTGADPAEASGGRVSLASTISEAAYWLIWLLFLPMILSTLSLEGLLTPVQALLDRTLAYLPNIAAAALILVVGWFVARIVQRVVANLLAAAGVDRLGARVGLNSVLGSQRLSDLLGLVVYILILVPVVISALNALAIEAVTQPAAAMLTTFLNALPNIFAAAILLIIAYVVGRLVAGLVSNLLAGVGFDSLPQRLGLGDMAASGQRPSTVVGGLVLIGIMLFAVAEAAQLLGFAAITALVGQFLVFAGQVVLGLIVLALGIWLANLAAMVVRSSSLPQARGLAAVTRAVVIIFAGAMALRQMSIAEDIINLAFALILGAVALAFALAVGLGGRDVAAKELEEWRNELRQRNVLPSAADVAEAANRSSAGESNPKPPMSPTTDKTTPRPSGSPADLPPGSPRSGMDPLT